MKFLEHSNLKGAHAILGASKYHWLNYSDEKLVNIYHNLMAVQRGTELHEFAAQCIRLGQRLPKSKKTLNMYVNDAIGFHMTPEQVLFYSENCFGTANPDPSQVKDICDQIIHKDKIIAKLRSEEE